MNAQPPGAGRHIHKAKRVPPDPAILELARAIARNLARADYEERLAREVSAQPGKD